jgi:hypothetical protein
MQGRNSFYFSNNPQMVESCQVEIDRAEFKTESSNALVVCNNGTTIKVEVFTHNGEPEIILPEDAPAMGVGQLIMPSREYRDIVIEHAPA